MSKSETCWGPTNQVTKKIFLEVLTAIVKRMKLILSIQITLNESVTKTSHDIVMLKKQKEENSNSVKTIDMKVQEIDQELTKLNESVLSKVVLKEYWFMKLLKKK